MTALEAIDVEQLEPAALERLVLAMSPADLERFAGPAAGRWSFYRCEQRRARSRRGASCGHEVDAREPYRYSVGKVAGAAELYQATECDHCYSAGRRS